jgi:hypothetical protein
MDSNLVVGRFSTTEQTICTHTYIHTYIHTYPLLHCQTFFALKLLALTVMMKSCQKPTHVRMHAGTYVPWILKISVFPLTTFFRFKNSSASAHSPNRKKTFLILPQKLLCILDWDVLRSLILIRVTGWFCEKVPKM